LFTAGPAYLAPPFHFRIGHREEAPNESIVGPLRKSRLISIAGARAMIAIELSKQARTAAIASLQRYFTENMPEPIGDLPAGLLLNFLLEEVGPVIYNRAISDAQTRMMQRVSDLAGELYTDEFQYWPRADTKRKTRR
jgi:uncharacterized protein (DUF2164 family)